MTLINVAYYVTGHGYGHATRSIELMRGLLNTGRYTVTVISSLNPQFFLSEISPTVSSKDRLHARQKVLDTGGIQVDAIHMDPLLTLDAYYHQVHDHRDELLNEEVTWLREQNISLVLIDATPLAGAAAKAAAITSIYVSNITWDFVYRTNLASLEEDRTLWQVKPSLNIEEWLAKFRTMVDQCEADVCQAQAFIQHQGQCPLSRKIPTSSIFMAPLICRSLINSIPRNIREEHSIPDDTKLLLLGFGGHSTTWQLQDAFLPVGWHAFVLRATPAEMPSSRFHALSVDTYVPEYIAQVDVVIGKMGYGTVSECLTAGRVLVYIPRVHWPEEDALASLLSTYNAGMTLSLEDFNDGRWSAVLEEAWARKGSWTIRTDRWEDQTDATASTVALVEKVVQQFHV